MTSIILSNPQLGLNIGSVARVMSNFGLTELRIVNPRDGWPNEDALAMAANGDFVIQNAKIFKTLDEALHDIVFLYGTASLDRKVPIPQLTPKDLIKQKHLGKFAILFGCERSGLSNDELSLCDAVISIQTSNINKSLNIAQAVAIIAYELFNVDNISTQKPIEVFATKLEVERFIQMLESELEAVKMFKSQGMQPIMMRNLRTSFSRMHLTKQDIQSLYGIVKALRTKR